MSVRSSVYENKIILTKPFRLVRADISCQIMKTRFLCRTVYSMNRLYIVYKKKEDNKLQFVREITEIKKNTFTIINSIQLFTWEIKSGKIFWHWNRLMETLYEGQIFEVIKSRRYNVQCTFWLPFLSYDWLTTRGHITYPGMPIAQMLSNSLSHLILPFSSS